MGRSPKVMWIVTKYMCLGMKNTSVYVIALSSFNEPNLKEMEHIVINGEEKGGPTATLAHQNTRQ